MREDMTDDDRELLDALRSLHRIEPPAGARDRFLARIEGGVECTDMPRNDADRRVASVNTRAIGRRLSWIPLAAAAGLALFLALQGDNAESTMPSETARRLEVLAVRESSPEALRLLETRLRHDPSPAVRVLSVDVLSRIAPPDSVVSILTRAAPDQASVFVQASMLTAGWHLAPEPASRIADALSGRGRLDESLRPEATELARLSGRAP